MLEFRPCDKYKKEFHIKHPNTITVESLSFSGSWDEVQKRVDWSKENILYDTMIDFGSIDSEKKRDVDHMTLVWYCSNEIDAMAVKLTWSD